MNELVTYQSHLPDRIEDIAKFLLIMPERLVALKAEIRAIQKADVAKPVLEQKQHELRMISELILDAKTKVGEFTRTLPKASGGERRSINFKSGNADDFERPTDTNVTKLQRQKLSPASVKSLKSNIRMKRRTKQHEPKTNRI